MTYEISAIHLSNFRGASPSGIRLPLAPITIVLGANHSGKSSILRAFANMAQARNLSHRAGVHSDWPSVGPWFEMGRAEEMIHQPMKPDLFEDQNKDFEIGIEIKSDHPERTSVLRFIHSLVQEKDSAIKFEVSKVIWTVLRDLNEIDMAVFNVTDDTIVLELDTGSLADEIKDALSGGFGTQLFDLTKLLEDLDLISKNKYGLGSMMDLVKVIRNMNTLPDEIVHCSLDLCEYIRKSSVDEMDMVKELSDLRWNLERGVKGYRYTPHLSDFRNAIKMLKDSGNTRAAAKDFEDLNTMMRIINSMLRRMSYVGADRPRPDRVHFIEREVAPIGLESLMEGLRDLIMNDNTRKRVEEDLLSILGLKIRIKPLTIDKKSTGIVQIEVAHEGENNWVPLTSSGFGVNQLLPVLMAFQRSLVVVMEEPESNLHPRAQAALMDRLAEHVKESEGPIGRRSWRTFITEDLEEHMYDIRWPRFILETHSEHLLLRALQLIEDGELSTEDISVCYVTRENGETAIKPLRISSSGSLVDSIPHEFRNPTRSLL